MANVSEKTPFPKIVEPPIIAKLSANVLVIDDEKDIVETIGVVLMREGYGVRSASSRDEALLVLDRYLYDVIVMDLFMPGVSAKTFIKEASRRCPRSQFILLTAADRVEDFARELGICHWIGKPFLPEDLVESIRKCME